jgi:hypothetical protein
LSSSSSCHPSSGGVRGRSPPIDDRRPIVRGSVFVERPHPPPRGRPRPRRRRPRMEGTATLAEGRLRAYTSTSAARLRAGEDAHFPN